MDRVVLHHDGTNIPEFVDPYDDPAEWISGRSRFAVSSNCPLLLHTELMLFLNNADDILYQPPLVRIRDIDLLFIFVTELIDCLCPQGFQSAMAVISINEPSEHTDPWLVVTDRSEGAMLLTSKTTWAF